MALFQPIAFLDTWELAGSLRSRINLLRGEGGERRLQIRWTRDHDYTAEALSWIRLKDLQKWPELTNALSRIVRYATARFGAVETGRQYLEMLDPGTVTAWRQEGGAYAERFSRVHLALRTNPAAVMFAGAEAWHAAQGWATICSMQAWHSAANHGEWPRVHLVVDLAKKEEKTDE